MSMAALLIIVSSLNVSWFVLAIEIGGPISTNPARHPIGTFEEPPRILMVYNDKEYNGELRSYTFESGDVNSNVPTTPHPRGPGANLTSILPEQTVIVEKNSSIRFVVEGNPKPEIQPDSLTVTAYNTKGTVIRLLTLVQDDKSDRFIVDLKSGEYILIATAVWLPNEDRYPTIGGSVMYAYKVNVT
jgi:hypothetical protein